MSIDDISTESHIVAAAAALGAADVGGPLSKPERALLAAASDVRVDARELQHQIDDGADPLGDAFTTLRTPGDRRPLGATYTPQTIISAMINWAQTQIEPERIVDPGAGSGRFSVAAGRAFPTARLVAVEIDPLASLCARAHLGAAGMAERTTVVCEDYRALPAESARTLWIGNPPYVRHHQIAPEWKAWLTRTAKELGLSASKLAGLHVHFFLATAQRAAVGDVGCFITSAEWMDVNYGSLVRELLLGPLGGKSVHVLDPQATPFSDAATTGAISCFSVGDAPSSMKLRRVASVEEIGTLNGGRPVRRERLAEAPRWSLLMRASKPMPDGYVQLGELCRVHRGTVTGSNRVFVAGDDHPRLPDSLLRPAVTKARELFAAGDSIATDSALRRVIDLPEDLDELTAADRRSADAFIGWARKQGAHKGYIARHRKAWWSVGLRDAAPILATYMARRPPTFVRNLAEVGHINIAHGLYPRQAMSDAELDSLAAALRECANQSQGRTYAGGLTKFEPREMERIPVRIPTG